MLRPLIVCALQDGIELPKCADIVTVARGHPRMLLPIHTGCGALVGTCRAVSDTSCTAATPQLSFRRTSGLVLTCNPHSGRIRLAGYADCAHIGTVHSGPKPICRTQRPRTSVWSGFRPDRFLVYFALRETFWNWPGSKPITTRRFAWKWQDETPGVTELLNGAWSSVPQR
jgi:hypothetical protein